VLSSAIMSWLLSAVAMLRAVAVCVVMLGGAAAAAPEPPGPPRWLSCTV